MTQWRTFARRSGFVLAGLIAAITVAIGLAWAAAQTGSGKAALERGLERLLSSPDLRVDIVGLDGRVPDRLRIGQITVADATGDWLTVHQAAFDWRPLRLLGGRLHIERLQADRVTLARLPEGGATTAQTDVDFSVPRLPFGLRADRIAVDTIEIGEPVVGQDAALRLSGSLSAETTAAIESALEIERLDGPPASVSANVSFVPSERTLEIDARMREASDGLIAHLLGAESLPALDIALSGRGPIADWRGQLRGEAGANRLTAELAIAAGDTIGFEFDGAAELTGVIPAELQPVIGPATSFAIAGQYDPDSESITLRTARLSIDAGTLVFSGGIDGRAASITGTLKADLAGPSLAPLIAPAAFAAATLEADITGKLALPSVRFSLSVRDAAAAPVSAASVAVLGVVAPASQGAADATVLDVTATLETDDFAIAIPALAQSLGARPSGFIAGDLDLARSIFVARDVRVSGAEVGSNVSGIIALDGAAADLAVSLTHDNLARLSADAGLSLAGAATLSGNVRIESDGIGATIRASSRRLSTGIAPLDALVGTQPNLEARIASEPDGEWQISNITLDGARASLTGEALVPADFDAIDARYALRLPDLTALSGALGTALAGSAESTGTITGAFDALALTARIDGAGLTAAGVTIGRAGATIEAADVTGMPNGTLALNLERPLAATARTRFRLEPDALHLSDIEAESADVRANGDLVVPTGGGAVTGTVRADTDDLQTITTAFGQPVSGRVSATLTFAETQGEPSLRAALEGRRLAMDLGGEALRVTTLSADSTVAYAREDIGVAMSLEATDVAAPPGTLETLRASVDGSLNDLRISASGRGDFAGETDLTLAGAVQRSDGETMIELAQLAGQLAGREIALRAPAQVRIGDRGYALKGLRLDVAGGEITGELEFGEAAVAGSAAVRALPVSVFAAGGTPLPLDGAVDGQLRLGGTPAQPQADLTVDGRGLELRLIAQAEPVAVDLSLAASLANDLIIFEARGDGNEAFSLDAQGRLPVQVSAAPATFSVDRSRALEGNLRLSADAGVIERIIPIDPHRLRGALSVEAAVAGTVREPVLTGEAALIGGRYENIEIGTVLDDVAAVITLADDKATVHASAKDGGSGQLRLSGDIKIAPPRSVDLALRMTDVTLVRRDEITAALSGDLFTTGDFGDLRVSGQVETRGIEVRLIDALPPEVVRLEVTEVGGATPPAPASPAEPSEPFAARLEIDVNIPNRLFVRGRGLDSEWQGNLRVFGTTQDAEVTGRISAVRGQYSFAGKTFQLSRGTIVIDEQGGEFVAILDVETEFTDDDFVAKINVSGPASKPELALSSTPTLPRDEILSRILFGRGTGQLSPLEALQLAQAAATLSGVGPGGDGILDTVRTALGVDVLQVSGGEGDSGPTVRAGKYVADGVFVGAKQGAGPGTSAATVEVELTPNLSVESEVGQSGRSEVGVFWQFNY